MKMDAMDRAFVAFMGAGVLLLLVLVGIYLHAYVTGKRLPGSDQRNEIQFEQK